jgi:hypothetical protein
MDTIIQRLETAKRINSEGKVGYEGWFLLDDLVSVLETCLSFSKPPPAPVKRRLITNALSSPSAAARPLTRESLLKEINVQEAAYFKTPLTRYFLATSISLDSNLKIPHVRFAGGSIVFRSELPKKFDREDLEEDFKVASHDPNPKGYTAVVVSVQTRSPQEAFDRAMEELDYIRGLWNFAANRASREVFSSGVQRPINLFCLGQVHTLHDSAGKNAVESYWYNTGFVHYVPIPGSNWGIAKARGKKLRRLVSTSNYPADLRRIFIRYARALDGADYEVSFIKLWSLLEFLTDCGDGRYDALVRRCAFLFKEPEYQRQILQHLRERRNLFVHTATESGLAKSLVFQLKLRGTN